MKTVFWIGLTLESLALVWFLYQIWLLYSGRSGYVEEALPEMYRKNLIPAIILVVLIAGALLTRLWFKAPKIALWIVCSPALIFVLSAVGMLVASMFIRDWR